MFQFYDDVVVLPQQTKRTKWHTSKSKQKAKPDGLVTDVVLPPPTKRTQKNRVVRINNSTGIETAAINVADIPVPAFASTVATQLLLNDDSSADSPITTAAKAAVKNIPDHVIAAAFEKVSLTKRWDKNIAAAAAGTVKNNSDNDSSNDEKDDSSDELSAGCGDDDRKLLDEEDSNDNNEFKEEQFQTKRSTTKMMVVMVGTSLLVIFFAHGTKCQGGKKSKVGIGFSIRCCSASL